MAESTPYTKDPTCGMSVHVATALHAVRDGRTYSFCSDQCLARFQAVSAGEAGTCGN